MAKLSCIALLGLLTCLVDGAAYIVGTIKPVTGSKAYRRAIAARDDAGLSGTADGLLDILDLDSLLSGTSIDPDSVLYRYSESATGFAAAMTPEQAEELAQHPDVVYVVPSANYKLATTHIPSFLGIEDNQALLGYGRRDLGLVDAPDDEYPASSGETDIVIGVIDSGAWPENPSYNDNGLPPPPSHWKGECVTGEKWTKEDCNNKLIGARWYYKGYLVNFGLTEANFTSTRSARADEDAHGTHCSTIAAGSRVQNVDLFGQASGTARGMAPGARLAIYKTSWGTGDLAGGSAPDILAAMDDALADGVNILSMSLTFPEPYGLIVADVIYQGAFRARQKGVLVFQSAGNDGPAPFTNSDPPWIIGVGASSHDRSIAAAAVLADGTSFVGQSISRNTKQDPSFKPLVDGQAYEFVIGSHVRLAGTNVSDADLCLDGTLDSSKAAGKMLVCKRGVVPRVVKGGICRAAGAAGMILYNGEQDDLSLDSDAQVLPVVHITYPDGLKLVELVKAGGVTGTIDFKGTSYGRPAPRMTSWSSRGPNFADFSILKPDITGPGLSIFAGWSEGLSLTDVATDTYRGDYNIISGTSMSCPVLAGLGAFVLGRRPDFTAAMVHSALMTTAYTTINGANTPMPDDHLGGPANALSYGNGHVDPVAALDPGLVYDITNDDWNNYVCGVNSSSAFIGALTGVPTKCNVAAAIGSEELNYPSFAAFYDTSSDTGTKAITFPRTLTSVSGAGVYTAQLDVDSNPLLTVSLDPETLTFTSDGDQQSYVVKVSMQGDPTSTANLTTAFGRLSWSDGHHRVSSSLVFQWINVTAVTAFGQLSDGTLIP